MVHGWHCCLLRRLWRLGHLGATVIALDDLRVIESWQIRVEPMNRWSVHVAELIGIFHSISSVLKVAHWHPQAVHPRATMMTILCNSKSVLEMIQNPSNKSGQQIIHAVLQATMKIQAWEIALHLQWIPGHCNNPGNGAADQLAKDTARKGKTYHLPPLLTREKALIHDSIYTQWEQEWQSVKDVACLGGYGNRSVVEREKELSRKCVHSLYTQVCKSLNAGSLLLGWTSGLYTPEGHVTSLVILVLSGIVL